MDGLDRVHHQAAVVAREEEPGGLQVVERQLEPGQLGAVAAEVALDQLQPDAQVAQAGRVRLRRRRHADAELQLVELGAESPPFRLLGEVRLAVALAAHRAACWRWPRLPRSHPPAARRSRRTAGSRRSQEHPCGAEYTGASWADHPVQTGIPDRPNGRRVAGLGHGQGAEALGARAALRPGWPATVRGRPPRRRSGGACRRSDRARSRTLAGDSLGSARLRTPVSSASQIGKSVMTGPRRRPRRPSAARTRPQVRVLGGRLAAVGAERGQQDRREQDGRRRWRARGRATPPAASSAGAGRPRRSPASSASRQLRISRTWTGPAACRNVPQVVETGKSRVVAANVRPATMTSGRRDRARGPPRGARPGR